MRNIISIFLSFICLVSCNNPYDAEKFAENYCDCMRTNNAVKDFGKAQKICDDELVKQNRYAKLYIIDMAARDLDRKISNETRDSVQSFILTFKQYTNAHCCKETLQCPDTLQVKSLK